MATGEPTLNGDFLIREVQEIGHDDIAQDLAKAEEIKARFGGDSPEAQEIRRKYDELRLATIGALRDLRIETSTQLEEIKKSLTGDIDFSKLSENADISESEKARIKELSMIFEESAEGHNDTLKTKDISELTLDEAKVVLHLSQEEYGNYSESGNAAKLFNMAGNLLSQTKNSYENIADRREMNLFQDALLVKIYSDAIISPGYTEEYLKTFSEGQGGNGVVSIVDFENSLKNTPPETWNSLGLIHYFNMLESKGDFNIGSLLDTLGAHQIVALKKLWENTPNGPAMQYFQNNPELSWIVHGEISYETLLQSRNGFEKVSQVFDAVDESERDKIRESLRYYMTDFLTENKNMSPLERIAGGENIGDVSQGMYRFTIEEARRTLIAKDFIDAMNARYHEIPGIGDVIKAMLITLLQGRGVDENEELTFSFDGINSMIQSYNSENSKNLPEMNSSTADFFLQIYSSGEILTQFSKNRSKLQEMRDEIQRLNREIADLEVRLSNTDNERDTQSFSRQIQGKRNAVARYYRDISSINTEIDENEIPVLEIAPDVRAELSSNSIEYILQSPKTRMNRITSASQLLSLYTSHPEVFSDLQLRNINIFLLRDPNIILQFPGKIDREDIASIPETTLGNSNVITYIREKDTSQRDALLREIGIRLTKNGTISASRQREVYALLREISQENPISEYILPPILREYHVNTQEEKIQTLEMGNVEEITLGKIQEIVSGLISGDDGYESDFGKINIFIEKNGYSDEIRDQLGLLINTKPELYPGLWTIHDNFDFQHIHLSALEKDIHNFTHLGVELRKRDIYIEKVFLHINESDAAINDFIPILDLLPLDNWDDVMNLVHLTEDYGLIERLLGIHTENIQGFIDKIVQAYENTDESRRRLIHTREDEGKIYQDILGLRATLVATEEIGSKIENIHENEQSFSETYAFINGLELSEEHKQRLKEILEQSGSATEFSDNFTAFILEIYPGDTEKIQSIIAGMLEAVGTDLAREKEKIVTTPPNEEEARDFGRWFREDETGELCFDEVRMRSQFLEFTRRLSDEEIQGKTEEEIIALFLGVLDIDTEHPFATRLRNFLSIEAQQVKIQAAQRNTPAYVEAVRTGKTQEYWSDIRRGYYSGEISYIPEGEDRSSINGENSTAQNPESIFGTYGDTTYTLQYSPGKAAVLEIGGKEIDISPDEAKAMQKNPEVIKNFIDADSYFSKAGLESVWRNYRNEIVIAMNMSSTTGDMPLDLSDDSLRKDELIRFAKFAYKIIFGKDASPSNNPADLQSQFMKYGNIYGEDASRFGDQFISDVTLKGIDSNKSSLAIASTFKSLAEGEGLQKTSSK